MSNNYAESLACWWVLFLGVSGTKDCGSRQPELQVNAVLELSTHSPVLCKTFTWSPTEQKKEKTVRSNTEVLALPGFMVSWQKFIFQNLKKKCRKEHLQMMKCLKFCGCTQMLWESLTLTCQNDKENVYGFSWGYRTSKWRQYVPII